MKTLDTWQLRQYRDYLQLEITLAQDQSYIAELSQDLARTNMKIDAYERITA